MRICYHLQTHKLPCQVHRLVSRLVTDNPDCIVLVSHDVRGAPLDVDALRRLGDVHVLPASGGYGDFSHLQRYLDSVDWLRRRTIAYEWFVNLSGQDYPACPGWRARQLLEGSTADGFLEHFPVLARRSPWGPRRGRDRYYFRYRRLRELTERQRASLRGLQAINLLQPLVRVNASYGLSVGVRTGVPFHDDFACYGGSFFATVRRACAEYLLDFASAHPMVVRHYRHVLAPEESFLQTVLVNSGRFSLVNDCKRYFDFSATRYNHPRTLTADDVPSIVDSGAHFARKFDASVDQQVLNQLDARAVADQQ